MKSCQHFRVCSGCSIDLRTPLPILWKDVIAYFRDKSIDPTLHKGSPTEWRCRAKLAVRGSSGHPLIGLFKEGSHEVVPIPFCLVHSPQINQAVEIIKQLIQDQGIIPYQEQTGQGELRYLQCVVERKTGRVQLTFVLNFKNFSNERIKWWKNLLIEMGKDDPENRWHSLWINLNDRPVNTIFGSQWALCYGEELLWETFGEVPICYQPASFAQANLDLFEKMLFRLRSLIKDQAKLAEFYAGVGAIGLFLTSKCQWVRCAEINSQAEFCFSHSKTQLNQDDALKISFHTGAAHHLLSILDDANTVIVDPPRKGLDAVLLQALNTHASLKQLLYVSCGWESFKRDCDALLKSGWQLTDAEGYLFFPGSNHIEILANFERE